MAATTVALPALNSPASHRIRTHRPFLPSGGAAHVSAGRRPRYQQPRRPQHRRGEPRTGAFEIGSVVLQLLRAGSIVDERRLARQEIDRFGLFDGSIRISGSTDTAYRLPLRQGRRSGHDGPSPLECTGVPVRFEGHLTLADLPRRLQPGDFVRAR
jgi:hypothetical protein